MVRSRTLLPEVMQYLTQRAEWVKVPFPETISRVICRTSNRIFVGVPLCPQLFYSFGHLYSYFFLGRDRDYQNLNLAFAVHVIKFVKIISWFPEPLKPCVVPLYMYFSVNETPY
jgi:hypothetical protein